MEHEYSPHRVAETIQHLSRFWEEKRKADAGRSGELLTSRAWTIALSREAGTQGAAIGHEVGQRLSWPVYDHELLERIAQDMGTHTRLLESLDERRTSWLLETFAAFQAEPFTTEGAYVHRLVKTVLALGSQGECVIVGRGAALILPAEKTLRVRLIAPLKDRIATIQKRLGLSHEKATRQVEVMDRERNSFVRAHFAKDSTDPRNYDLILHSTRLGVAGCAQTILAALKCLETAPAQAS